MNQLISRRSTLTFLGSLGTALLVTGFPKRSHAAPTTIPRCIVRPEQTEGPYFVDEKLNRSDIRANPGDGLVKTGVPLQLALQVSQIAGNQCQPLPGAIVDIWHCDAAGVYSDVADPSFNTAGQKFLRGYQITDATGKVQFVTIYPGWYPGRTVHIHFKVRAKSPSGKPYEFTSQLYFDDALTDLIHAQAPYAQRRRRTTRNNRDGIYGRDGKQLMLAIAPLDRGYMATFNLGLQMA